MDLKKIGKFIADCRKNKKLTQEQLAEKLYITDRAVSKWERGLSLPDADKMIELCNILGISVNELLIGEVIDMKDYNKKTEELLLEFTKKEEINNKRAFMNMWVLLISTFLFYTMLIMLACMTLSEGPLLGTIICVSTVLVVIVAFYALKVEVYTGYYECNKCHHRHVPSYWKALIAPHMATTRFLRCPKCHKFSWSKKVMTKE
jgi:transcriptional regulator with XRE-family HTH domain